MPSFTGRVLLLIAFMAGAFIGGVTGQESDSTEFATTIGDMVLLEQVREIFSRSCATGGCHSGTYPKMKLSLEADDIPESVVDMPSIQYPELMRVDPGEPEDSYLLIKIAGGEEMEGKLMPINLPPLKDEEIDAITMWINSLADAAREDSIDTEKKSP
jgi:hypothetical protein